MLNDNIKKLIEYGLRCGLIEDEDKIYVINRLLELFGEDSYKEPADTCIESRKSISDELIIGQSIIGRSITGELLTGESITRELMTKESIFEEPKFEEHESLEELEEILKNMLDYAYEKGLLPENTVVYRDLFDTRIMALLISKPSELIRKFWSRYEISPKNATNYYYKYSQDTDYIRRYRVKKDMKWVVSTEYGDLDITINLSKPEKDPRSIADAKNAKQSGYPKCLLCMENEGYAGTLQHPARQNHRIIPIQINGQKWGFQYSPYVYYNEHCIVLNSKHIPMKINKETFIKLFDFIKLFPHYFLGSNADLPIVGGSILSHDHFQGGNYEFAMAKADIEENFVIDGFEMVEAGIVKWPLSVIRLKSKDTEALIDAADYILNKFRGYTDESVFIYAETKEISDNNTCVVDSEAPLFTDISEQKSTTNKRIVNKGEPHNTITPIARMRDGIYELDLVLRNNITTKEHPLGVFHPHAELHHIKKENIGLIEVMGLAVLPSRLKNEMEILSRALVLGSEISTIEEIKHHAAWAFEVKCKYNEINESNIDGILKQEIGLVFKEVLEHSGIFKRNAEGRKAFKRFVGFLQEKNS